MKHPVLVQLGANIRDARKRLGVSQEELAHRANLHRTYIGMVERGERNLTALNVLRIALALQIEPGALLTPSLVDALTKQLELEHVG